jgi:dienelactone hydrolase
VKAAACAALCLALATAPARATHEPWTTTRFPQDEAKWWWDADWWQRGAMPVPASYEVATRRAAYRSGEVEVPVEIHVPKGAGRFPVVIFLHGRRGIDPLTRLVPLRLAARGQAKTACYVSYYPHWQHPEAPEALQVYQYAPEVDALEVPVLVFVGEHEQYQRVRPILAGVESLQKKKREARVIVYPGVGRGFDFRPPEVRTYADDLATQDSLLRATAFIRQNLGIK